MKVALSAGSKEFVLRPSKPGPKTMNGDEPLQEPRSRVLLLAVVVEVLVVVVEEVLVDAPEFEVTAVEPEHVIVDAVGVAAAATAAAVEDAATALAVAVAATEADPLTPAEARAALISSAVTSATRRFCVKMQPVGSFWSSPIHPSVRKKQPIACIIATYMSFPWQLGLQLYPEQRYRSEWR